MNKKIYQYKKKYFIKIKSIQIMRKKMSIKIEYKKNDPFLHCINKNTDRST